MSYYSYVILIVSTLLTYYSTLSSREKVRESAEGRLHATMPHAALTISPKFEVNWKNIGMVVSGLACFRDLLLVGTTTGMLVVYSTRDNGEPELLLTKKKFGSNKQPVTDLTVIEEFGLLLSLSNGNLLLHELNIFYEPERKQDSFKQKDPSLLARAKVCVQRSLLQISTSY